MSHSPLVAVCKYKIQHSIIIHKSFSNKTTQASDSASVWVAVHEVCPGAFLHLVSSFISWSLTTPPAHCPPFFLLCRFHRNWASCACTSLCQWTDRWNALRMSSAAAFPASLHAQGFSVKGGGRQLVIYCCNKHWQANDNILSCFAVLFSLLRDFWLCFVGVLSG